MGFRFRGREKRVYGYTQKDEEVDSGLLYRASIISVLRAVESGVSQRDWNRVATAIRE